VIGLVAVVLLVGLVVRRLARRRLRRLGVAGPILQVVQLQDAVRRRVSPFGDDENGF
jgi:hypothetical protein